jgi:hypothetical protein
MAKKKSEEKIDPTLPFTEVTILGKTYKLCFTFRAIAKAESKLLAQGVQADLLSAMVRPGLETLPVMFAAGLSTFHPELAFAEIEPLVDYDTFLDISEAVSQAWVAALPKRKKVEDPPPPVQS